LAPRKRKLWHLLPHDPAAIDQLSRTLRVAPIVAQLLLNRKLHEPVHAERFLSAPLSGLYEPERLPGVVEATERIWNALQQKRPICIFGDYDVDGVTGTAILLTLLKHLDAKVEFHVPHRLEEGYGLNAIALGRLAEKGVKTVVTVDCGIASIAEAELARQLGLELIITDHHEPKDSLPRADVLVHPRLPLTTNDSPLNPYPFGGLSGAGVAFKLAWALCKKACGAAKVTPLFREFLLDAIVLAALGTVADVVPLCDENRIYVRYGLSRLRSKPSIGLLALLRSAKIDTKSSLGAVDIGFSLAPRLNAAGRLDTARCAVELLTTSCAKQAGILAERLEGQNLERQNLERRILYEARHQAESDREAPALVLASPAWHPGLLGIVASRLVDLYSRPVLMIALRNGLGQGSGRSVPGFRLHEALTECTHSLISHGGHAAAAGFRIRPEAIDTFRLAFQSVAGRHFDREPPTRRLTIDAEIPMASLTNGLLKAIELMEPFGAGNAPPLFLAGPVQIVGEPRLVGNGERHLSFRVRQQGKFFKAIAFGMADRRDELMSAGGQCCIAFIPRFNEFQGWKTIELEIRDFQAGTTATLES
jgi:single-stranded-DNA-specific exonuclease